MRSLVLFRRPKVAEQAVEGPLVGVMVLPPAKVADVARPPDIGWPAIINLHNGIVETDREENGSLRSPFSLHRRLNLFLDPFTLDGVLGKDEQQLAVRVSRS